MKCYWSCPYCYILILLFRKTNTSYDALERRIINHLHKRHSILFSIEELPALIKIGIKTLGQEHGRKGGEKQ